MPGEYRLITDEVLDKETELKRKDSELLKINDSFHELIENGINEEIGNFFKKNVSTLCIIDSATIMS